MSENKQSQVLFLGRFQPLTILHYKIIQQQFSLQDNVVVQIVNGKKSQLDVLKNPFDYDTRKLLIQQQFKNDKHIKIIEQNIGYIPNIIKYQEEQFPNLKIKYVVCGSDRVNGYKSQIEKQLNKNELDSPITIEEIDRDVVNKDNISQTKLRIQLYQDDYDVQKILMPKEILSYYDVLSKYIQKLWNNFKNTSKKNLNRLNKFIDKNTQEILTENLDLEYSFYDSIPDTKIKFTETQVEQKETNCILFQGRFQPITKVSYLLIMQMFSKYPDEDIVISLDYDSSNKIDFPFPVSIVKQMFKEQFKEKEKRIHFLLNSLGKPAEDIDLQEQEIQNIKVNKVIVYKDDLIETKLKLKQWRKDTNHDPVDLITIEDKFKNTDELYQTKACIQLYKGNTKKIQQYLPPTLKFDINLLSRELRKQWNAQDKISQEFHKKLMKMLKTEIQHIDDLNVKDFISWLNKIMNMNSSELLQTIKYDGVQNISFTIDKDYNITQGRVGKNDKKTYSSPDEYPKNVIYNPMRSQFTFFLKQFNSNKELFKQYLDKYLPITLEFEIVSPIYTNILQYNLSEDGNLVFIRQINSDIPNNEIEDFQLELKSLPSISFDITQYQIDDSDYSLSSFTSNEKWKFNIVKKINLKKFIQEMNKEKNDLFKNFENILSTVVYNDLTVEDVLNLTNEDFKLMNKNDRQELKRIRKKYMNLIQNEYIKNFKEIFLNYLNKQIEQMEDGEIEGIVLRDGNKQVKIVDKTKFTDMNKQVWSIMQKVKSSIKSLNFYFNELKTDSYINIFQYELFNKFLKTDFKDQKELKQIKQLFKDNNFLSIISLLDNNKKEDIEQQIKYYLTNYDELFNQINKYYRELKNNDIIIQVNTNGKTIDKNINYLKSKILNGILSSIQFIKQIFDNLNNSNISQNQKYLILLQFVVNYYEINKIKIEKRKLNKNNNIMKEGGNQFDNTSKIKKEYIDDTVNEIYNQIIQKLLKLNKEDFLLLGSQKKKPISGDLDIQVSLDQLVNNDFGTDLKSITNNIYKLFKSNNIQVTKHGQVISILFPIYINNKQSNKFVQVDFMIGNLKYLQQYMYSPYLLDNLTQEEIEQGEIDYSKYKQNYRNVFLQNLFTNYFTKVYSDDKYNYIIKINISYNGIYKVTKQQKKGQKTWKVISREKLNNSDLITFFNKQFKTNKQFKDISTFEKLLNTIKTIPIIMNNKDKLQKQINDFVDYLNKNNLFVPTDLLDNLLKG